MAFYDIDTEYQNLLDHGLTDEQILSESGIESNRLVVSRSFKTGAFWGAQVGNRMSQDRWDRYYAARIAELEAQSIEVEQDNAAQAAASPFVPEAVRKARAAARSYGFRGEVYDD